MQEQLISHCVSPKMIDETIEKISERIINSGDKEHVTVQKQLNLLNELSQFDFGRFLLQHQGLNGYWTHYVLTHPWFGRKTGKNNRNEPLSTLEDFLLNCAPGILATQQRFEIFLNEIQKETVNNASLACIPCGIMIQMH